MTSHPLLLLSLLLGLACGAAGGPEPAENASTGAAEPAENASTGTEEPADTEPTEASSDAPSAAELPATFGPGQGETAFGVYWGPITPGGTVSVQEVMAELEARGVTGAGSGEISCDLGAAEALGVDPDTIVVSVSFRTRAEADRFVAAWDGELLGVAEFEAFCRD